ncbi:MAG: SUMF1/EgtB/PvdO family nonheme iron enzyme, partial [Candidatus Omnitrophica bacterium]|nr:SUMF1/EgtB/PvdO family nonheme iron enzyme [Candidatus Omnitrophota bacterium]
MMDEIHKRTSPLRIFLCHSSGDKPEVRNLYHRLSSDGFDPWLDEEKFWAGQEWEPRIAKTVQTSDVVIVCLSLKAINKAGYVQKEIKYVLDEAEKQPEGTIFIIPLKLEECDVPERLQRWHWVNLFEKKGYERLLSSLRLRAETITSGELVQDEEKSERYLFSWDKVPGNDSGRLIEFLMQNFNIEWIKAAKINKNDDGKTIRITNDTNFLSLTLNNEKNNVNLEIDDGRTDKFIVKTKNGELNIYSESIESTDEEKSVEPIKPQIDSISSAALCDQYAVKDALGFECYVNAIAEFLTDSETEPPLTISIEGKWGTGKSSFMAQLENTLKKRHNLTVSFNAWRHDKEDSMWAAFAIDFLHQIASQQKFYHRWTGHFKLFIQRLNWKNKLYVIRSLTVWFAFIVFTGAAVILIILKGFEWINPLITGINGNMWDNIVLYLGLGGGAAASIGLLISIWMKLKNIIGNPLNMDINKYIQSPDYENRITFIENFHKDFENIVKAYAGDKNVYVFIDDLDRCEIPKAADMMQAINLMISPNSQLIFIIGMDREKVAASIAVKHEKLLPYLFSLKSINAGSQNSANEKSPHDTTTSESVNTADILYGLEYGYEFIEKFIQLPFLVPQPTGSELDNFLKSFSEPKENIRTDASRLGIRPKQIFEDYSKKIAAKLGYDTGRIGRIKKGAKTEEETEKEKIVDIKEGDKKKEINEKIKLELGTDSPGVRNIAMMVAPALDNNPRRIKQFINLFRLRAFIAKETGLLDITGKSSPDDLLTLEQLGKFIAISLKWPLFIIHLDANRSLLAELQQEALDPKSAELNYWSRDEKFMNLLRAGCLNGIDTSFDPEINCNLSTVNVDRLLQVSPRLIPFNPLVIYADYTNSIGIKFVHIKNGEFMMGSKESEDEQPIHNVTIDRPFYFGIFPVTQREWKAIMGDNPSQFKGDDLPVENVSWNDVQEFIKKLNKKGNTHKYRLPSEAEWEYAARAGTTTRYSFGDDDSKLEEYAWYSENSGNKTHPVGKKGANPWGLYDVHGNIWEWVQDEWHDTYNG